MNKKILLPAIIFLVLLFSITAVTAPETASYSKDDVFTKLIENKAGIASGTAIFEINNPLDEPIPADKLFYNFVEVENKIDSYETLFEQDVNYYETVYDYSVKGVCYDQSYIDDETQENMTKEVCYDQQYISGSHNILKTKKDFIQLNEIPANFKGKVKLIAHWKPKLGRTSIEWVPSLKLGDTTLTQDKWAWWNSDYAYRRSINCSNCQDGTPIIINGTYFGLDGKKQYVQMAWKNNENLYLYYNNYSDYAVANNTAQKPMDVIWGNESSYMLYDVYNESYKGVYHLEQGNLEDASGSGYNITMNSAPVFVPEDAGTCKAGGCYRFDGTDDYFNTSSPFTTIKTISVWVNTTGIDATNNMWLGQGTPGTTLQSVPGDWTFGHQENSSIAPVLEISGDYEYSCKILGTIPLNTTSLTHIVLTCNGSLCRLYENGVNIGNCSYPYILGQSGGPFYIGRGQYGTGPDFYGAATIDEIILANYTWSYDEVKTYYDATKKTVGEIDTGIEPNATESEARTAIESGINSALTSPVIYTDQQVYLRNNANNQNTGRFDKVAKYSSQRWLFNYITANESSTGMFNLTPVVYVLEMGNLSAADITEMVSELINATKT